MRKLPKKRSDRPAPKRKVPTLAVPPKKPVMKGAISERWSKCSVVDQAGRWNGVGWVCPLTEDKAIYVDEERAKIVNRTVGHYRQIYIMDYGFTIRNETQIKVGGVSLAMHRAPPKRLPPPKPKRRKLPPKHTTSARRPPPTKKAKKAPPRRKK